MSAPTRFVRDWIVSRYADKVLDIIKKFKKTIQRIEFFVEETEEGIYLRIVVEEFPLLGEIEFEGNKKKSKPIAFFS